MGVIFVWLLSGYAAARALRREAGNWFDRVCGVLVATIPVIGPIGYFIGFETPSRVARGQRAQQSHGTGTAVELAFDRGYVWEKTEQHDAGMPGVLPRGGRLVVVTTRLFFLLSLACISFWTNSLLLGTGSQVP